MESSRRGPAAGGAGDGHRFPDPPPAHGEREPMLVTREALLSQLHMALLRQEIIEADLAKIESAMALRVATGHQTQTTPMPMPWHVVVTADAGRLQPWPFSADQPMAGHKAGFDEHKLPDSNKDALLSQLHMARLRQENIQAEVAQIERAMALHSATGCHQTQTMQMPMPMPCHGLVAADAGRSKPWPFNAEQPTSQQNADFDEHKLPDSNKVVPSSKALPAEKWELTGITIPVTQPKLPMKWNCIVCQVQATSEHNLQQHFDGQKHLSNVATLDPTTEASDQKAKSAAEYSLGTEQKKTSSIKWSCSTCQANGTSQMTLEAHLKGKRHQQNIATTCVEGDMDGMPKNVAGEDPTTKASDQKAKLATEHYLSTEQKKTSSIKWSCSTCQANGTSQLTLQAHLKGKRHQQNIATTCGEGDMDGLLKNVSAEDRTTKASDQKAKSAAEYSLGTEQKKTSSIKWSCSTCQAHGTSQLTLEAHLKGKRHQLNIAATCVEDDMGGIPKNVAGQEAKSRGINMPKNSDKPWLFIAEQPMGQQFDEHKLPEYNKAVPLSKMSPTEKWEQDLQQHYAGQKHLSNVATLDPRTEASVHKAKTAAEPSLRTEQKKSSSIKWCCSTCQANSTSQSTFESHLKGKRHQQNIGATSAEGDKNSMTRNVSAQKWNCTMCEVKCTSDSQFEGHCRSSSHRQKIQAILGRVKFAKASSSRTANEAPSAGSYGENSGSEMAALYFCEVCSLLCDSGTALLHHRFGKKHGAKLSARNESS